MKVFYSTDHDTVWPVGGASIVVAEDAEAARRLLDEALLTRYSGPMKLDPNSPKYTLQELILDCPSALILLDGNY